MTKIETYAVTNISVNSAEVKGEILDIGESEIVQHGHCWSTLENPTILLNTKTALGKANSRGGFTGKLYGLQSNTQYYIRAYATDKHGTTVYSSQKDFMTSFMDSRDGKMYRCLKIGNQVWMAENLAYLPAVSPPSSGSYTEPYYYVFGYYGSGVSAAKALSNYSIYGVLYNWPAAMDGKASSNYNPSGVRGVCPYGWHLPSHAEWDELSFFLGGDSVSGGKLKEAGYAHWQSPNEGATNSSGFTALPGGSRNDDGDFEYMGGYGAWWSATENNDINSWYRVVGYGYLELHRYNYHKDYGFSIRCIKDE
ncbi:MAG: fibrobacter succinogenes major paralogous domain-containing protein [Bacteroidales bacterium]|nr:fibrobacter succinogenes major paralogous domain-containing protein [Bacteroidales bacterium]